MSTCINTFWYDTTIRDTAAATLPEYGVLSLETFARFRQHTVNLWTFQQFGNVPAGVQVCDASSVLDKKVLQRWLASRVHIEHISDLIRARILAAHGGWWVDLDVFCMRPFNVVRRQYAFMSFPAKRKSSRVVKTPIYPTLAATRDKFDDSLYNGFDWFNNAVMKVPKNCKFINRYAQLTLHMIEAMVSTASADRYGRDSAANFGCMVVAGQDLVRELGLEQFIEPPAVFHPHHVFKSEATMLKYLKSGGVWDGHQVPSIAQMRTNDRCLCFALTGEVKASASPSVMQWMRNQIFF